MNISKAFEGYKLSSLANGLSPRTIDKGEWALKKLINFLDEPEVENITERDIKRFFVYLQTKTKLSPSSIQACWVSIRSFYNWAEIDLEIDRPDTKIKMPVAETKQVVPFSEDEVKKLLAACLSTTMSNSTHRKPFTMKRYTGYRDKALILFLLDTGLRISECARIEIRDINLENGEVIVRPFRRGRKSKSRIVYISQKVRKALWRYLADRHFSDDDFLFVTRDGNQLNKDNVRQMLDELSKRSGVKKVFAHKFRHTFAIQYLRNGGDIFSLQRLLGHSTLTMVKNYLAIAQVDLENAHRKASPVENWRV